MSGNYPPGVTDNDPHFDMPSAEQKRGEAWRPIETCPKSMIPGKPVIVLLWNGKRIVLGFLEPDDGDGFGDQFVDAGTRDLIEPRAYGDGEPVPTHWMPLPSPPTSRSVG